MSRFAVYATNTRGNIVTTLGHDAADADLATLERGHDKFPGPTIHVPVKLTRETATDDCVLTIGAPHWDWPERMKIVIQTERGTHELPIVPIDNPRFLTVYPYFAHRSTPKVWSALVYGLKSLFDDALDGLARAIRQEQKRRKDGVKSDSQ